MPQKVPPALADVPTETIWTSMPASCAVCSVRPRAATCGSVNVTRGAPVPSARSQSAAFVLAGDLVGGHAGLVLGHVGEQCAAVGVPDDPEPVVAGDLQVLVNGQVAVPARLYPDGVEAEPVGVDMPPGRDEQLVPGE